jgi:hypothetical protein
VFKSNLLCFFAKAILDKKLKGFENMSFAEYLIFMKENMFIVESNKKFKKETDVTKPFFGKITLENLSTVGKISVATVSFSLNKNAAVGTLKLVFKK